MNPTPTHGSALTGTKLMVLRMITVLWVENEGEHVGANFLPFESAAYGDIIGPNSKTHVLCSWARGQAEGERGAGGVLSFEELFTQGHLHHVPKKCLARRIRTEFSLGNMFGKV